MEEPQQQQQQQRRTWQEKLARRVEARALYGATTMAASALAKEAKRLNRRARSHAIASLKYSAALPSITHFQGPHKVLKLKESMDLALHNMQTAALGVAAASDAVAQAAGKWDEFCRTVPAEDWSSFLLGMPCAVRPSSPSSCPAAAAHAAAAQ